MTNRPFMTSSEAARITGLVGRPCAFLETTIDNPHLLMSKVTRSRSPGIIVHVDGLKLLVADSEGYLHEVHIKRVRILTNFTEKEWLEKVAGWLLGGAEVTNG